MQRVQGKFFLGTARLVKGHTSGRLARQPIFSRMRLDLLRALGHMFDEFFGYVTNLEQSLARIIVDSIAKFFKPMGQIVAINLPCNHLF